MITIFASDAAHEVERYAAEELRRYLSILYRFEPQIRHEPLESLDGPAIVIGDPRRHKSLRLTGWPQLKSDGFCLRTVNVDPDVLVIAGGSARGTMFGVYELLERFGVCFMLSGDVLPPSPRPFRLTGFDERLEPAYAIRATRPLNNLPEGSAGWALDDFKQFIDQMARLKFNTFVFGVIESGPWLDYEFRGLRRPAGDVFYGYRFPIDDRFIGKELFGERTEFYNPALAEAQDDDHRTKLGIDLLRGIIRHCASRDLMSTVMFSLLEPPTALKHRFNEWASLPLPDPKSLHGAHFSVTPAEEFGTNPRYAAWMNVLDPVVHELTAHRLKALIDTYPDADSYQLWVSEHRAGVVDWRPVFAELDRKYGLKPAFDFEEQLNRGQDFPFGRERYQHQMKGDLLFLYAFDKVVNEHAILRDTSKPDAAITLVGVMPQLAPLATRIIPEGTVFGEFLDYGTHGVAQRIDTMLPMLADGVPAMLEIGIHDDNTMYFPQVSVESQERIVQATAGTGMLGYVAALWQVRQSDINGAYLAAASWRPDLSASEFYAQWLAMLAGSAAAPDFEQALRTIEKADRLVKEGQLYGYAFPMDERLMTSFMNNGVDHDAIGQIRPLFESALSQLVAARDKADGPGVEHLDFWLKRTRFALQWLALAVGCANVGRLLAEPPDAAKDQKRKQSTLVALDNLLEQSRALIELVVGDAKHICDLGQIANMNHHVHRVLERVRADVEGDRSLKEH
jgi:hypothetical protein